MSAGSQGSLPGAIAERAGTRLRVAFNLPASDQDGLRGDIDPVRLWDGPFFAAECKTILPSLLASPDRDGESPRDREPEFRKLRQEAGPKEPSVHRYCWAASQSQPGVKITVFPQGRPKVTPLDPCPGAEFDGCAARDVPIRQAPRLSGTQLQAQPELARTSPGSRPEPDECSSRRRSREGEFRRPFGHDQTRTQLLEKAPTE